MPTIIPACLMIPTMNRNLSLQRTLEGYMAQPYVPSHIVVVDQSTDAVVRQRNQDLLNRYANEIKTTYVYQAIPSITKARNLAMQHGDEEVMIFSDDDIDVNEDTLANVHRLMNDGMIAMIAGIDENSPPIRSLVGTIGYLFWAKSFWNRNIGHVTLSMLGRYPSREINGEVDTQWAMGYFFVVRRSLVEKWHQRFDDKFAGYGYAEDLDFSYAYYKKAKSEGLRCVLSDKVKVKHLGTMEFRTPSAKSTYMFVINREYLSYKHRMGFVSRLATRWANFGAFVLRLAHVGNNGKSVDVLRAQWKCDANRRKIKFGELDDTIYR